LILFYFIFHTSFITAADAFALADAVAVRGGHGTTRRRRQLLLVGSGDRAGWPFDAVLEAANVAGINAGVLPALGLARLVAAAELGHGGRWPLAASRDSLLALHCTTCFSSTAYFLVSYHRIYCHGKFIRV
jgi:hypothetical protein